MARASWPINEQQQIWPLPVHCALYLHPKARTRDRYNPRGVNHTHRPASILIVLGEFQGKWGMEKTNQDVPGAHCDQGPWDGFQNPKMTKRTSGCCPNEPEGMPQYTQSADQGSLVQLQPLEKTPSEVRRLIILSSLSWKGKSCFVIRRNQV